jgi:hypothetical protein
VKLFVQAADLLDESPAAPGAASSALKNAAFRLHFGHANGCAPCDVCATRKRFYQPNDD